MHTAARTVSRRDSHSGPAGQLGRVKSRGAAVIRENRASARGLRRENWFRAYPDREHLFPRPPCLDVKRGVDVARAPRDCLKLNVGDKEPRRELAFPRGPPGSRPFETRGPSWPQLAWPPALPLTPDRSTASATAVSFALFLPHLLPLSLLDSPAPPASTWRTLRNASSDPRRSESSEFHGPKKKKKRTPV